MNQQDHSLLILSAIGFVGAIITFFVRRATGKTRALSTTFSVWVFGSILALGILLGFVPFSRHSMGLERFVIPIVVLIATGVVSIVSGLLVHLFEYRKIESTESLSLEAQVLLQTVEHDANERRTPESFASNADFPPWKRFAIEASKQSFNS